MFLSLLQVRSWKAPLRGPAETVCPCGGFSVVEQFCPRRLFRFGGRFCPLTWIPTGLFVRRRPPGILPAGSFCFLDLLEVSGYNPL